MTDIFYTSDLHLGHEKIISIDKRPFVFLEEMHEIIIDNINNEVKSNDTLKY